MDAGECKDTAVGEKGYCKTMDDKEFAELGREIGEKIDKFVNSREIKELQDNIRKTVENTVDGVRKSAQEAVGQMNKNVSQYNARYTQAAPHVQAGNRQVNQVQKYEKQQLPMVKRPQGQISGVLMEVLGICGATVGWTTALLGYSFSRISVDLFGVGVGIIPTVLAAVLAGGCTVATVIGSRWRKRAGRFNKYKRMMVNKDFYSISGLAQVVHKKAGFVIKDLKWMIRKGWFKEGHLDMQETCFMLTDNSYKMYLDAQSQLEQRKVEEERRAEEERRMESDPVRKQLRMTIEEGKECIRRIRRLNDDIPGQEISNKLYRLEDICTRIFMYIEKNPEKLPEIRKFMSYYLPTTLKLVEQYREFDRQPVMGENIAASKKEIEDMLDDINAAFEKMYDNLFADDAMDVSTDISVLSTMLAQEGLLDDELTLK